MLQNDRRRTLLRTVSGSIRALCGEESVERVREQDPRRKGEQQSSRRTERDPRHLREVDQAPLGCWPVLPPDVDPVLPAEEE